MPIIEKILIDSPVMARATMDPQTASGSASMIVKGVTKDSYKLARTRKMKRIPAPMAKPIEDCISFMFSA